MRNVIFIIRHLLIIVAIIGSLYITEVDSYVMFTFASLLFVAIDRLQVNIPDRSQYLIHLIKMGYIGWLSIHYGGIFYVLSFSSVFSLFPLKELIPNTVLFVLYVVSMNVFILQKPVEEILLANIVLTVIGTSLYLLRSISRQKEEIQYLYDALRRNHYELDEARRRMIEYARKIENVAQVEERNRISKDLHDELGHKLIRIKMMVEAILRIIPLQQEKGMEMLYNVRDHLSEGMESLRSTVRRLKPEDTVLRSYSLKQLIEDFGHDSGVTVDYEVSGIPFPLYPSEEVALYRNAQEAMTNAIRHGEATEVAIHIYYHPTYVEMSVSNNGRIPEEDYSKGLGLKGMEERIELLGGHLEVVTKDRFAIKTILPHKSSIA